MKKRFNLYLRTDTDNKIKQLKLAMNFSDESAAVNDAIAFRFRFAKREAAEISCALTLYDELRSLTKQGYAISLERPNCPERQRILLVGLGD